MKLKTIVFTIIYLVISTNSAFAERRYNRHYNKYYRGHGHSYSGHRYNHVRHNYYGPSRYYNLHYKHDNYAGYLLGGLIVGTVIGTTLSNTYNNESLHINRGNVNSISNSINTDIKPSFILQPDGSCYVIDHVTNGRLVLAPVSSGNCQ